MSTSPLSSPSRASRSVATRLAAIEDRLAINPDASEPCALCGQPPPRPTPPMDPAWRTNFLDTLRALDWLAPPPPTDDELRRNRDELLADADRLDRLTAGDPDALSWPACPRCGEHDQTPGPLPVTRRRVRSILRDAARGWTETDILAGKPEALAAARTEAQRYRQQANTITAQLAQRRAALENRPPAPPEG